MKKDEAKQLILAQWLTLPPPERRTEEQAAQFAMRIKDAYAFRCCGDRYQVIKGWCQARLPTGNHSSAA